jgi:hypothetical protein
MKHVKLFEQFVNEALKKKVNEATEVNEAKVQIPDSLDDIFVLDKKMPFGLPSGVADYYVSRSDGKTGASRWDSFEELIKANPGVRFGTFANSSRITVFQALRSGEILVMSEVYIQK